MTGKRRVLVTGASGFIGGALLNGMRDKYRVRGSLRTSPSFSDHSGKMENSVEYAEASGDGFEVVAGLELGRDTDWSAALTGIDTVVHTAALVHMKRSADSNSLEEFRRVNVEGTLRLARQCVSAGINRFVFLSSIKVNGEETRPGRPFRSDDFPNPQDPYGISKHEAEQGLLSLSVETGLEVVIVRPVLVYGPGVKANFESLMRCLCRGIPLPLGSIRNGRSLVALENLVDLVRVCCEHPAAAGQTFLVSDGEDLSTTDLITRLAAALNRPPRLISLPPIALKTAASLIGKTDVARRLLGDLQVDIEHTCETLDWKPVKSVDRALQETADFYSRMH
jgi:nucleoside-diphosphate-sugar epimerase